MVSRNAYLTKLAYLGVAGFALWMAVDLILVRFAPERMHDFEWLLSVFGIVVFCYLLFDLRQIEWPVALSLAALGTVCVCALTLILALSLGVWFHLSIGGSL